ncbi:hypothetical protein K431DRAFT_34868 [Polychaeton citri CBS 116435]|uniref:Uncharacterized protein n=1 Tax=Polychaeton citri CBS 116435 TaxID=1314669 RepID=A0A9P4Q0W2_9PEZI|nr:hypothetical protein K431DRAFT_34868 [Polychaeton citri CBS 116435]
MINYSYDCIVFLSLDCTCSRTDYPMGGGVGMDLRKFNYCSLCNFYPSIFLALSSTDFTASAVHVCHARCLSMYSIHLAFPISPRMARDGISRLRATSKSDRSMRCCRSWLLHSCRSLWLYRSKPPTLARLRYLAPTLALCIALTTFRQRTCWLQRTAAVRPL